MGRYFKDAGYHTCYIGKWHLDSAYTCSPVCTPARAGLFTGIYANQSGPWTNNVAPGKNISTMGRYFKDAGYHTCYIGKWHLDGHDYFGTTISALASVRRSGTLITGSMGRTTLAN